MSYTVQKNTNPATSAGEHACFFREPIALTRVSAPAFSERFLRVSKSKQGASCRRIRLGDLSKANVGWARVVER